MTSAVLVGLAAVGAAAGGATRAALSRAFNVADDLRALAVPAVCARGAACPTRVALRASTDAADFELPAATLIANIAGSLLLALLTRLAARQQWSPLVLAAVGTGYCGGFTTMSTFAVECASMVARGKPGSAAAYWAITQAACAAAVAIGWALGSLAPIVSPPPDAPAAVGATTAEITTAAVEAVFEAAAAAAAAPPPPSASTAATGHSGEPPHAIAAPPSCAAVSPA